ncbi:MAG: hypothetical protein NTW17_01700 [Candidatus Pacearchaeota archaeon]|nr:hypothetical protein [Candidatus Pacearchaeota archaeon]
MKFLRRNIGFHLRIGKRKKRKQVWRKPKGRDNKMRECRKGRPPIVSIGYGRKKERKNIFTIYNVKDLEDIKKEQIVILGKIGKKKKIEILKKAMEKKINFQNINTKKFFKKNEPK